MDQKKLGTTVLQNGLAIWWWLRKNDKSLRLGLDPKPLNAAILRQRYVIPTPADVQSQLSGKLLFSMIDMKDGYWHVDLSKESYYLTTFHALSGKKRFRKMPFGIFLASEVMRKHNETVFGDIDGVYVIADDIIVAAKKEKSTMSSCSHYSTGPRRRAFASAGIRNNLK